MQENTNKFIKDVMFELHPTFPNRMRYDYPNGKKQMKCSSIGWGYFNIPIVITFKDEVGLPNVTIDHMLNF